MNILQNKPFFHERESLRSGSEIHIHIISPLLVDCEEYEYLLDDSEIEKSRAFIFEKDRNLYQTAHIFLRSILSQYSTTSPENWSFSHNNYGKPAVKNDGELGLSFNLSHTHNMIACVVGYQYDLGVDIEGNRALEDLDGLCNLTLCDTERNHVLSAPLLQQEKLFYRYWTLKEAYIKAIGKGLTIPLKKIKYEVNHSGNWECSIDLSPDKAADLHAMYRDLPGKYSLAMCANIANSDHLPTLHFYDWNNNGKSELVDFRVKPKR